MFKVYRVYKTSIVLEVINIRFNGCKTQRRIIKLDKFFLDMNLHEQAKNKEAREE